MASIDFGCQRFTKDPGANPGGYQRQYRNVLSFLLLILHKERW
nr:MAG TPA: hypothetical protein [Caudoviricetes sp.]